MAMMAEPKTPRNLLAGRGVCLLDDHEVVRRGLRHLLESEELSVAGESGSARRAFSRIPALRPELVILDDGLPTVPVPTCAGPSPRRPRASGPC